MALDRAEICRRLSPSTLSMEWTRSHYTSSGWRIRALMASGILIALSVNLNNSLCAILQFILAFGLMRTYFIQPNEGGFLIFKLHQSGLEKMRILNAEVIQTIRQHKTSSSFCDRGVFALIELEKLRSLNTALEGGPFRMASPSNTDDPSKQIETLLKVSETFSEMHMEYQWLKELESKLNQMTERYVSTLRYILLLPHETGMSKLTKVVNDYATLALKATEQPYSPLPQVA